MKSFLFNNREGKGVAVSAKTFVEAYRLVKSVDKKASYIGTIDEDSIYKLMLTNEIVSHLTN